MYYCWMIVYCTWENFGGGKFWRINGSKVFGEEKFGESVSSLLKILAFINIGGENFGELPTVRQICQNFPPPKFSHIRYIPHLNISCNFFMPIIAKHQPLHRPSIQSPHTIATISIFDVIVEKIHCYCVS